MGFEPQHVGLSSLASPYPKVKWEAVVVKRLNILEDLATEKLDRVT